MIRGIAAAMLGALVAWRLPWTWHLPAYLYLAGLTVSLMLADLSTLRLPNRLTLPAYPILGAALAVAAIAEGSGNSLLRAVAAGAVVLAGYATLHAIRPTGLGAGDVKLAGALGLMLGWISWDAVLVGVTAGLMVGGAVGALLLSKPDVRETSFAFGPAMLLGTWAAILVAAP